MTPDFKSGVEAARKDDWYVRLGKDDGPFVADPLPEASRAGVTGEVLTTRSKRRALRSDTEAQASYVRGFVEAATGRQAYVEGPTPPPVADPGAFNLDRERADALRREVEKHRARAAQEGRKARQRGKTLRALSRTLAKRYREEVRVYREHRDGIYRCLCWACYAGRHQSRRGAVRAEATPPVDLSALRTACARLRACDGEDVYARRMDVVHAALMLTLADAPPPDPKPSVPQEPAEPVRDGWRKVDGDTAFAMPFGTVRQCIDCGCLVGGGPTRCVRCVKATSDEEGRRHGR